MSTITLNKRLNWYGLSRGLDARPRTGLELLQTGLAWIALDVTASHIDPYFVTFAEATRDGNPTLNRWRLHHFIKCETLLPYVRYTADIDDPVSLCNPTRETVIEWEQLNAANPEASYPHPFELYSGLEEDGCLWGVYSWSGEESLARRLAKDGWLIDCEQRDDSVGIFGTTVTRTLAQLKPHEMRSFKAGHFDIALQRVPHPFHPADTEIAPY